MPQVSEEISESAAIGSVVVGGRARVLVSGETAEVRRTTVGHWGWPIFALVVIYALVGANFGSFTLGSNIIVFASATVFLGVAVFRRPEPLPSGPRITRRGTLTWTVVLGTFTALELVNFFLGSTSSHPTLSILMAPILQNYWARAAALFIWLGFGVELVRR